MFMDQMGGCRSTCVALRIYTGGCPPRYVMGPPDTSGIWGCHDEGDCGPVYGSIKSAGDFTQRRRGRSYLGDLIDANVDRSCSELSAGTAPMLSALIPTSITLSVEGLASHE